MTDFYFQLAFSKWRLLNPERSNLDFDELRPDEQKEITESAEFARAVGHVR